MSEMSLKDFAQKVEWEGGLVGALDYYGSSLPVIKGIAAGDRAALNRAWHAAAEALNALETTYSELLEKKGVVVE